MLGFVSTVLYENQPMCYVFEVFIRKYDVNSFGYYSKTVLFKQKKTSFYILSAITVSSQNIIVQLHYQQKKTLCSRWLLSNI
jgi:hypothetical protein